MRLHQFCKLGGLTGLLAGLVLGSGCGQDRITRTEAIGLLIPIDPAQVEPYPADKHFVVVRSPKSSSPFGRTPTVYDAENDLFYHGIYIDEADYRQLSLASSGQAPATITRLIEPGRPHAVTHSDAIQAEMAAIQDILKKHPDIGRQVIQIKADEADAKPSQSAVAGIGPATLRAIEADIASSIKQLETLFGGPVPSRLAADLRAERKTQEAKQARAVLLAGTDIFKKLFDQAWLAMISAGTTAAEAQVGQSWLHLQELWLEIALHYADGAEPSYETIAPSLRTFGAAMKILGREPSHEAFLGGKLFAATDGAVREDAARRALGAMRDLSEQAVTLLSIYRPRTYVDTPLLPNGVYDDGVINR